LAARTLAQRACAAADSFARVSSENTLPVIAALNARGHAVADLLDADGLDQASALLLSGDLIHPAHRRGQRAVAAARARGIPSISVQHGWYRTPTACAADIVCSWSNEQAGHVTAQRIVVTGDPYLDALGSAEQARRAVGGRTGFDRWALFAASLHDSMPDDPRDQADYWEAVEQESARRRVIVRPHPHDSADSRAWYRDMAQHAGAYYWEPEQDEAGRGLAELLAGADYVLGWSGVVWRAAALGIPVRALYPMPLPARTDGRAAERVARVIEEAMV
jgi:hypothetical protein